MSQNDPKKTTTRRYALVEVVSLLNEGGRSVSLSELKEACANGALEHSKVRGRPVVTHADVMNYLSGPNLKPKNDEAELARRAAVAQAKDALTALKSRIQIERSKRDPDPVPEPESNEPVLESPEAPDSTEDSISSQPEVESENLLTVGAEIALTDESPGTPKADTSEPVAEMPGATDASDSAPKQEQAEKKEDEHEAVVAIGVPEDQAQEEIESLVDERPTVEEGTLPSGLRIRCALHYDGEDPVRHGLYESWYDDNTLAARGHYVHGKLDGTWEQWHANGQLQSQGSYSNGLQNGHWVTWDEQGQKLQEGDYVDGAADGLWCEYHGNGSLWRECRFSRGTIVGSQRYFDTLGQPVEYVDE